MDADAGGPGKWRDSVVMSGDGSWAVERHVEGSVGTS